MLKMLKETTIFFIYYTSCQGKECSLKTPSVEAKFTNHLFSIIKSL